MIRKPKKVKPKKVKPEPTTLYDINVCADDFFSQKSCPPSEWMSRAQAFVETMALLNRVTMLCCNRENGGLYLASVEPDAPTRSLGAER